MELFHDNSWGAAYLQVSVVVFVFALGLPSLFIQLAVPPDLRRIQYGRLLELKYLGPAALLLLLLSLAQVWCWHRCPAQWLEGWKAAIPAVHISLVLVLCAVLWWRLLQSADRNRVVETVGRRAVIQLLRPKSTRRAPRQRKFRYARVSPHMETPLEQLFFLAKEGQRGADRLCVIHQLGLVARSVTEAADYSGEMLQLLLPRLPEVVVARGWRDATTREEFRELTRILAGVMAVTASQYRHKGDFGHARRALQSICMESLRLGIDDIAREATSVLALYLPDTALFLAEATAVFRTRGFFANAVNECQRLADSLDNDPRVKAALLWAVAALADDWGLEALAEKAVAIFSKSFPEPDRAEAVRAAVGALLRDARYDAAELVQRFGNKVLQGVR